MSAGMVSVPVIIPLKAPGSGTTGSRKWMINASTLVEVHSNTKDCLLFYTLNGSKPDPFKKIGDRTTYQYSKPFTLNPGKRTVKAIAVLKDGTKESSINTKVFQVDPVEEKSDEETDQKLNTTWEEQALPRDLEDSNKVERNMFKKVIRKEHFKKTPPQVAGEVVKKVLTDSPSVREIEKSNDDYDNAMRCLRCNTPRPADPYARFCNGCGSNLPPAPGRIRSPPVPPSFETFPCANCGSIIPSELSFCTVCDIAIKTNSKTRCKNEHKCANCGTTNPPDAVECLVCDEKLKIKSSPRISKTPRPSSDYVVCPFCSRVNSADARFCDWCREKPQPVTATTACQLCFTENSLYSQYCCSCGKVLPAPVQKDFEEILENGELSVKHQMGSASEMLHDLAKGESPNWRKVPFQPTSKKRSKNASTQAGDGVLSNVDKFSSINAKPSPGKGFWRQQVEHVNHHLKVYTQNNLEFRESFSKHVISRLITASVEESTEDSELVLTVRFGLRAEDVNKIAKKGLKNVQSGQTLINAITTSSNAKSGAPGSRPSSGRQRPGSANSRPNSARKKKTHKAIEKEKIAVKLSKLSEDNLKLLNMIKSTKTLDQDKVQELLDLEDVNPNTKDENNIPLLKLCILQKHFDIIQILIKAGAYTNETSGMKETTALHEAVLLGITGKDAVVILLENDASPDVKDKKGKTPYELALDSGTEILIDKFTKHSSQDLLKDVMKI